MAKFDRQIATAARLIQENGQLVTWRQIVDGAPADSDEPWKPGEQDVTDTAVYIVFLPEDRRGYEFLRALGGTTIPVGNLVGLMAAQSFTPTLKDVVLRDGTELAIRTIDALAPNGDIIMYSIGFDK